MVQRINLESGEIVEVRSFPEIRATLDAEGKLEGVPFMPEMLPLCGRRFRVFKRAEVTCSGGSRTLPNTVHVDQLRCDGSAHFGCQARCLLFWKEAWLRRVEESEMDPGPSYKTDSDDYNPAAAHIWLSELVKRSDGILMCQATELRGATLPMSLGRRRYISFVLKRVLSGKIKISELRSLWIWSSGKLIWWWARAFRNKERYRKTPVGRLELRPGEVVQVRTIGEILKTLDRNACNRGLAFKPEMFHYCGRTFRVVGRVERRVNEYTGEFLNLSSECIILESVFCRGQRCFCSRSNYHYWREIWLRRI